MLRVLKSSIAHSLATKLFFSTASCYGNRLHTAIFQPTRYQGMEEKTCPEFVKPTKRSCPTKILFVSNANTDSETIELDLRNLFQQFGEFDETFGPIFISKEKVCWVILLHPMSPPHDSHLSIPSLSSSSS